MKVVAFALNESVAPQTLRNAAEELYNGACQKILLMSFPHIPVDGVCFYLDFRQKTHIDSVFFVDTTHTPYIAVFTAHHPSEFVRDTYFFVEDDNAPVYFYDYARSGVPNKPILEMEMAEHDHAYSYDLQYSNDYDGGGLDHDHGDGVSDGHDHGDDIPDDHAHGTDASHDHGDDGVSDGHDHGDDIPDDHEHGTDASHDHGDDGVSDGHDHGDDIPDDHGYQ